MELLGSCVRCLPMSHNRRCRMSVVPAPRSAGSPARRRSHSRTEQAARTVDRQCCWEHPMVVQRGRERPFTIPAVAPEDVGQDSYMTVGQISCPTTSTCVGLGLSDRGSPTTPGSTANKPARNGIPNWGCASPLPGSVRPVADGQTGVPARMQRQARVAPSVPAFKPYRACRSAQSAVRWGRVPLRAQRRRSASP